MKTKLKKWIIKQSDQPAQNFAYFTQGGYLFVIGAMIIVYTNKMLVADLKAEIFTLIGLLLVITGIIHSLRGYLGLSVFRILRYFIHDE